MNQIPVWSGTDLLNAFALSTQLLTDNRATIDALNVYPVPDGDTGTNMSLTMQAALDEARAIDSPNPSVRDVAQRIAHGSLLGARGNSGVILSQIFRGLANEVSIAERIDGRDLARGLRGATDVAYKAVMRPVEGTMLTVIRVAAERAELAARIDPSLNTVLEAAVAGARDALAETPNLLRALKDAGVVDSGGQGVVLALEGFLAVATGSQPDTSVLTMSGPANVDIRADDHDSFGYCTNFMISGSGIPFETVRAGLAEKGQSAVIVGDDQLVKVHIHTEDPGTVLAYAITWGSLSQIKIDNMNAQAEQFATKTPDDDPVSGRAIVAVASGSGIADTFRSMGVRFVVDGGSTMNPSIDEMRKAVDQTDAQEVILLPNNGNVLLAAQQVPGLSRKAVTVLATRSIVQGLAAVSAFNGELPLPEEINRMNRAIERATTVEFARADKDAVVDGLAVKRHEFIGLIDDRLTDTGANLVEVVSSTLERVVTDRSELITLFTGVDLQELEADLVARSLEQQYPECDVELISGKQPHYLLVVSVE